MDMQAAVSFVVIGFVGFLGILMSEYLRRRQILRNEEARKAVHFLHALGIALWAYFLPSYWPIIVVECIALAIVLIEKHFDVLPGMRAVERLSYGEVLFMVGVIILALLDPAYSHFVIVMLHLGIADAIAAVVGKRLKSPTYTVQGHLKSIAGSSACYAASLMIFMAYLWYSAQLTTGNIVIVAVAAGVITLVENTSLFGSDNLTMPLTAYILVLLANI